MEVLQELRIVTHDVHERLHHHPLLLNLINEKLTRDDYVWVLRSFERFYEGLNARIGLELIQEKLSLIKHDTDFLGCNENPLPRCMYFKSHFNSNHSLGVKYVIIGSALGGSLISKNIEKQLKLKPGNGNSYFGSSPDTARKYWKNYQLLFDKECTNKQQCNEAALNTFEMLEKWLWDAYAYKKERG